LKPNLELQNEISTLRSEMMKNNITTQGDGDYGFIDWGDMPSGSYSSKTITNASSTSWITTSDTSHLADNHCGATVSTNIALYYATRGYRNLKINNSEINTFKAVHKIIGNGPVMMIAGGTKQYFQDRGYSLSSSSVDNFFGIKSAADNNQIQGILLANGIVSWHWILALGYRQYNSGGNYMRIHKEKISSIFQALLWFFVYVIFGLVDNSHYLFKWIAHNKVIYIIMALIAISITFLKKCRIFNDFREYLWFIFRGFYR